MSRFLPALVLILALAACGTAPSSAPTAVPTVVPGTPLPPGTVTASAEVLPARQVQLSLLAGGTVREVTVKEGDVVHAGQPLLVLSSPELEYGVTQAEAAARAAELRFQYWIPARHDRPPEKRQLAEQQMITVQKSLDTARALLGQASLSAPFDATVISVGVATGEIVQPTQAVMTLADLSHLRVETTDLSERDIRRVKMGQKASVYVEALDDTLNGTVSAIAPMSETVGGDVVYRVTIELDSIPSALRWGMTAEVHINTE